MPNFIIKKVAVLGAGVMGAQIAAHLANARVDVLLYDLPAKEGNKSAIAMKAVAGLRKMNPAPLGHPEFAAQIQPANYDEHLDALSDCDLVIEAIAERMDWKHDLYAKIAPHLGANTIMATNTSGLSINELAKGFDASVQARFCGVHFFNPPRYMHLVELIPTESTSTEILEQLETFMTTTLGKGVVHARDTPNFIANRIGTFGMLATIHQAREHGITFDVVDDLTGKKLGRAKSGTFRTADLVGLDTLAHVIKTMQDNLPDDPFAPLYATPPVLQTLVDKGALGQKTKGGFYTKLKGKILQFDQDSGDYVPAGGKADKVVARILKKDSWAERLQLLRESDHPQAQFMWSIMRDSLQYSAIKLEEIAGNARDVDLALRFGFGWKEGPFEIWQQAGWVQVAQWIQEDIDAGKAIAKVPLPAWVNGDTVSKAGGVHTASGSYSVESDSFVGRTELPVYKRQVFRASVHGDGAPSGHTGGETLFEDDDIRLWTLTERGVHDVVIASLKSKMHAIGPGVAMGLLKGLEMAEAQYKGMVIWSPDEPFSVGADLAAMMPVFMSGGAKAVGPEEKKLQDAMLALRYAQVPTVAAVSGMALGGGCELAIYCSRRVASIESYIGLVEVGVGLIPGAGGLTYGARRAAEEQRLAPDSPLLNFLKKYFMAAATAEVAKSAHEAQAIGYLQDADRIIFNNHELLYSAVREAKAMSDAGYRPPRKALFPVAGRNAAATITAQIVNMRDGGFISEHDFHLGKTIAHVMCGGDVEDNAMVDEEWIMALEREAFVSLLEHPKTQERIMGMMSTGKPVRN